MSSNTVIVAGAGSRKTQHLIDTSLEAADRDSKTLIAAYTTENQQQIANRLATVTGIAPGSISVSGWLQFLINEGAKPFQRAITGQPFTIRGLNFEGEPSRYVRKQSRAHGTFNPKYFIDPQGQMYGRNVADFVYQVNDLTDGKVVDRIQKCFDHILIDEAQDLAGWDFDILDLLLEADLDVTIVADPRQRVYATNRNQRNRNLSFMDWVDSRSDFCDLEERTANHRSNQDICDFANALFPDLPQSLSADEASHDHQGVFELTPSEVPDYHETYSPQVLRDRKTTPTQGLPAMNFGLSKGSEYDHVLIFPTRPIREYLNHGDPSELAAGSRAKLYVAVTRARHSVAFVVD